MAEGRRLLVSAVVALVLAGCGGGQPARTVNFMEPRDGATVSSPVTVKMQAEGITIEPAGTVREGAGHFHIMIDTPCVPSGQVIPQDDNHRHYGKAQTEATLELAPGQHTLCLQAADGAHNALPLTNEITITVQ